MNLLRSEWIKLTSTKSGYWLYGLAIVFAVGIAALIGQFEQASSGEPIAGAPGGGSAPLFAVSGVTSFTITLVWIAAIVAVTGEYRYHTMKTTFLAAPQRWKPVLAKTGLFTALSMIVTAIAVLLSLLVAGALSGNEDWTPFRGEGLELLWKFPVFAGIGTLFCLGLAYIMRNAAGTIALLLVWQLAVESLVMLIPRIGDTLSGWMPFLNGNFWVQGEVARMHIDWSQTTALGWFAAVCVVVWAAGVALVHLRDA